MKHALRPFAMSLPTRASFVASGVIALAIVIATACGGSTTTPSGSSSSSGTGSSGGSSGASSSGAGGSSGTANGSSGTSGSVDAGPVDQCDAPTDCAWGEIGKEILTSSDCMCLFGCPHIPLSKTTVDRRKAQYSALCTPDKDGTGKPCPVDDCAPLKDITCVDHKCVAGSPDAGDGG